MSRSRRGAGVAQASAAGCREFVLTAQAGGSIRLARELTAARDCARLRGYEE